jgi:hypothetical protein
LEAGASETTQIRDQGRLQALRPFPAAAEHMNKAFPADAQLSFFADFRDDVAERRAAELLNHDKDDDEESAA